MINFRYHLVSLVAVFLALTVGIVMGSTVIDRAIVEGLRQQISDVRDRADRTRSENRDLTSALRQSDAYIAATERFVVDGRLEGVPTVVLAVRGADADAVRAAAILVQEAGAREPAIVWLEPRWALGSRSEVEKLTEVLGSGTTRRGALRTAGLKELAERLGAGGPSLDGDVLAGLANAGFVSLEAIGDQEAPALAAFPGAGARVLLVDGPDTAVAVPRFVDSVAAALAGASVPTVAAEEAAGVSDPGERGRVVAGIRGDADLSRRVSTVDGLETGGGRVAAVLALSDLARGVVGSYGTADGARAPVPPWAPPPPVPTTTTTTTTTTNPAPASGSAPPPTR